MIDPRKIKFKFNLSGDNLRRETFYLETFSGYDTIVELGVAQGQTSKIFLKCAKNVIGVDIGAYQVNLQEMYDFAEKHNSKYTYINDDDLLIEPIDCDILFVDSDHTEEHVYAQLKKYSPHVKTYIALHDINPSTFGGSVLRGYERWYNECGNDWEEYYRDYDRCGLLVIKRKS